MIYIKKYSQEFKTIWDNFVNTSKTPMFMFNRDFMEYHSNRFEDASIMFYNEDELIGVMPASSHGEEVRSHGGLTYGGIISNKKMKQHTMLDCFESLKLFYHSQGFKKLIYKSIPYIYYDYPAQEDLYALFRNNALLVKIECSCTVDYNDSLTIPKGRKSQISRARREGTIVKEVVDFETFIDLENEVLKKYHNAKAVHSGNELKDLHEKFPRNVKLFMAYDTQKQPVGGSVIFIYKNVIHTQYLAANDWARKNGALDLVIKEMLDMYRGEKKYFDFGTSNEDNGRVLNEGLMAQKEGFGGRVVVQQTWELSL